MIHKLKPNLEGLPEWGLHVFVFCEGRQNSKNEPMNAIGSGTAMTAQNIMSTGLENATSPLKGM